MDNNDSVNKNSQAIIPDFVTVLKETANSRKSGSGKSNFKLLLLIGIAIVIFVSLALVLYSIFRPRGTGNVSNTTSSQTTIGTNLDLQEVTASGTIRIWGLWEKESDFSALIKEFNKKYPNIIVEYADREVVNNFDPAKYKQELIQRITDSGSNTSPDIFMIHSNWTDSMIKYMYPMPTSVYTADEYKNTFYQTFSDTFTSKLDNKIYAIPSGYDGLGLYYNKKLLAARGYTEPATNWDSFRTQVFDLSGRTADGTLITAGVSAGSMNNVAFGFDLLSLLMLQNGTTMTSSDGKTILFDQSQQASEALKFYSDLGNEKASWDADQPLDVRLFAEGKLAFLFAPAWRADGIKKANALLDFDIAPVPQLSNVPVGFRIDLASYWGFGVSKSTKNPSLAWTFLKFMSEKDGYRSLFTETSKSRYVSQIYPRRDMASEISGLPFVSAFIRMAPNARTWKMYERERIEAIFRKEINTGIAKGVTVSQSTAEGSLKRIAEALIADIANFK